MQAKLLSLLFSTLVLAARQSSGKASEITFPSHLGRDGGPPNGKIEIREDDWSSESFHHVHKPQHRHHDTSDDCKPWDTTSSSSNRCKPWDPSSSDWEYSISSESSDDYPCRPWDPSSSSSTSWDSYLPCHRRPHRSPCRRPLPPPCPCPPPRPRPCPCVHTTWTTRYIWPTCHTSSKSSSSSVSKVTTATTTTATTTTATTTTTPAPSTTPVPSASTTTVNGGGGSAVPTSTVTQIVHAQDCTTMVFCQPIGTGCPDNVGQISSVAKLVASSGATVYVNGAPVATITNTSQLASITSKLTTTASTEATAGAAATSNSVLGSTLLVILAGIALLW